MNGRVRKEYVQRLSKNLSNQELGLKYVTEEDYDADDSSSPVPISLSSQSYYHSNDSKRNREPLVQTEYMAKYNKTLQAVRGKRNSYKLKRRKIAPSLQKRKKNSRVVSSPYFPIELSDAESEDEEVEKMSSSTSVFGTNNTKRSLGRQAAARYPKYGLLDLSSSVSPIGVELGDSSFVVPGIKDRNKYHPIPREDGFDSDDDEVGPFGDEWQQKEFFRQQLLEKDLNYRFIYLLAGNVNTSVIKLYDEDRLEDMILRRMNVRRQMQTIRQIEETQIPHLRNDKRTLENSIKIIIQHLEYLKQFQDDLDSAQVLLDNLDKIQKKINDAASKSRGLANTKLLLAQTQNILSDSLWMNNLNELGISNKNAVAKIKKCTKFLFKIIKGDLPPGFQKGVGTLYGNGSSLRALFVCLSHFVAYLWQRIENKNDDIPIFLGDSAMETWREIILDPVLFESKFPKWDLSNGDPYSDILVSLRSIWISYWIPLESIAEEEEEEENSPPPTYPVVSLAMRERIEREFSEWQNELQLNTTKLETKKVASQQKILEFTEALGEFDETKVPQNLDDWVDELRSWMQETNDSITNSHSVLKHSAESLEATKKKLKNMETIQPPRVKYQTRKGWALSPQHSGHVPLEAKVVAAIEAAIDVMRDVKNELRGARASYILNVLQAGANVLQHSPLSRAAFAKLVASRMALQEEYFPSTWTRKEQMGRIRIQAASALRSLSNLRWNGSTLVDRQTGSNHYNRLLMQPTTSMWGTTKPHHIPW